MVAVLVIPTNSNIMRQYQLMDIYLETIKQLKITERRLYVHKVKFNKDLLNYVNEEINKKYPNNNEPLGGKIFLLLNPEEPLYCSSGKKRKYGSNGKYYCTKGCQCIQDKMISTNLKVWKCENVFQNEEIKNRIKESNIKKYGKEHPMQDKKFQENRKKTCLEKYGTEHPTQNKEIKEKTKQTNLKNIKVAYPMQNEKVKEKSKKFYLENYDVENASHRHMGPENVKILHTKELFVEMLMNNSVAGMAKKLNVICPTIYNWHKKHNLNIIKKTSSTQENELAIFLIENNIYFEQHNNKIIKPYELDFYFSEKNIAIEIQGDYWHMNPKLYTVNNRTKRKTAQETWDRDELKFNMCKDLGVDLIAIWESDWEENKEKWKEKLLHLL